MPDGQETEARSNGDLVRVDTGEVGSGQKGPLPGPVKDREQLGGISGTLPSWRRV